MTELFDKKRSPGLIIDPSRPYLSKEILASEEEIEKVVNLLSPEFREFHEKLSMEYDLSVKRKEKAERKIEKRKIEKKSVEKLSFYSKDKDEKVSDNEISESFFVCKCNVKHFYPNTKCEICEYEIEGWKEVI